MSVTIDNYYKDYVVSVWGPNGTLLWEWRTGQPVPVLGFTDEIAHQILDKLVGQHIAISVMNTEGTTVVGPDGLRRWISKPL